MALVSKIRPFGNSKGIILPQAILDQLDWKGNAEIELQIEGKTLILARRPVIEDQAFERASKKVFSKHRRLMKRLA